MSGCRASTGYGGVLCFPRRVVVGEVVEPDLLVLGRGVEDGPVFAVEIVLGGDRVEDGVALLLAAPVGHGEDRVRPVGVRGALVAVGDATNRRHPAADLLDLALRDP